MNPDDSTHFLTTRWTRVQAARGDSADARRALSELCEDYYRPVVQFLRREGRGDDDARELAHEFFARILERPSLNGADPSRGRFRSYLLGALKHFAANRRARAARQKRGGNVPHEDLATDLPLASGSDAQFDREWALSILERVFARMKEEARQSGKTGEFELLKPCLTGETASPAVAQSLGCSDGALRVAIHRLRKRFRELVRAEIAQTVPQPADIPSEMQHLIAALS